MHTTLGDGHTLAQRLFCFRCAFFPFTGHHSSIECSLFKWSYMHSISHRPFCILHSTAHKYTTLSLTTNNQFHISHSRVFFARIRTFYHYIFFVLHWCNARMHFVSKTRKNTHCSLLLFSAHTTMCSCPCCCRLILYIYILVFVFILKWTFVWTHEHKPEECQSWKWQWIRPNKNTNILNKII